MKYRCLEVYREDLSPMLSRYVARFGGDHGTLTVQFLPKVNLDDLPIKLGGFYELVPAERPGVK